MLKYFNHLVLVEMQNLTYKGGCDTIISLRYQAILVHNLYETVNNLKKNIV